MSIPLVLTFLAGSATLFGGLFGVITRKPSNRLLGFSLGFAAGIMLLISLMEMLPAALSTPNISPALCYGMFIVGLVGYFMIDRVLPHEHPQDIEADEHIKIKGANRVALLLTLGITLHNFPEGIATYVTASADLDMGIGIAMAIAIHNIPEGLAVAGPVYAATGSKSRALLWAGISGLSEIAGGLIAFFILGPDVSPIAIAAIMAAVAGIMVALSIDELMPAAKRFDPERNPSYGILFGMTIMGFSLALLQT